MDMSIHELGMQRALLFQGFACFGHDQARLLGLDRLYFVTREGEFFKAVHDSLFEEPVDGRPPIDTKLIEASRQSTFGPSISVSMHADLNRLWKLYPRITPIAFLKSLNLQSEQFAPYFARQKFALDQSIEHPWRDPGFLKILNDSAFVRLLRDSLETDRELAKAYFSPLFADNDRIGIVEIGWQGSIQDNLALLFPDKQFHGFYLGLAAAKNPPVPNSVKAAFGPDRNRPGSYRHLLDAVNVLEFMLLAPGGSVARYTRSSLGGVSALRTPNAVEDALIRKFSLPFQSGVIRAGSAKLTRNLVSDLAAGTLRSKALSEWSKILGQPHPALVESYFSLKSNEEFGMGEFRDQSQTPTWRTIGLSPFSGGNRSRLIRYLTYSQWAQGMRRRRDLPALKRWILYVLMRMAIAAKPVVQSRRKANSPGL